MKRLVVVWVFFFVFLAGCGSAQKLAEDALTQNIPSSVQAPMEAAPTDVLAGVETALDKGKRSISITAQPAALDMTILEESESVVSFASAQKFELKFSDTENPLVAEEINAALNMVSYRIHSSSEEIYLKADGGEELKAFSNVSYFESYDILCLNEDFLSLLVYTNQFYDDSTVCNQKAGITFDLTTGKQLKLEELLLDGGMEALSQAAYEQLVAVSNYFQSDADSKSMISNYFEALTDAAYDGSPMPWCLSDEGLLLFLGGSSAANTLGTQTVLLRYGALGQILKPKYLPREVNYSGVTLRVELTENVPSLDDTSVETLHLDGSQNYILITTDTFLPELRISQIAWVNGQAVVESDLYAANFLSQQDAVCLEVSTQAQMLNLQLQYCSDEGAKTVYLSVQDDELMLIDAGV
ncbi:MAG: hypothetical protein HFG44_01540 [Oscillospiraceae bacterium]|nr:hypothetical protein [Oscillospiraceae bacterium]